MAWPINLAIALIGAGMKHKGDKMRQKEEYERQKRLQEAQNNQIARQNMYNQRMLAFKNRELSQFRKDTDDQSKRAMEIFEASLAENNRDVQEDMAEDDTAYNADYLLSGVSDTPVMLAGQEGSAPTVKAVAKDQSEQTAKTRKSIQAYAKYGALTRDRNQFNARSNADAMARLGFIGNEMRGTMGNMNLLGTLQPEQADYIAPKLSRPSNAPGLWSTFGNLAMLYGGAKLGGNIASGVGKTAPTVVAGAPSTAGQGFMAGASMGTAGNMGGTFMPYANAPWGTTYGNFFHPGMGAYSSYRSPYR